MPKPSQIPAVVAPVSEVPRRIRLRNSAAFLIPLDLPKKAQGAKQLTVEHKPGKPSIILLKIMAMETYSGNAAQADRRRRFCKDFVAPLKAISGKER